LGALAWGGAAPHNPGGNLRKLSRPQAVRAGPAGPCCAGCRAGLVGRSPSRPVPAPAARAGCRRRAADERPGRRQSGDGHRRPGDPAARELDTIGAMNEHPAPPDTARFALELMVAAARLYYLQDATQAELADRLGTSPTVSRLLAEARRVDIVGIDIVEPTDGGLDELAGPTAASLGISKLWLVPAGTRPALGTALAPARAAGPAGRTPAGGGRAVWSPRVRPCTRPPRLSFPSSPASSSCRRSGAGTSPRRGSRPTRSPVRSPSRSGRASRLPLRARPAKQGPALAAARRPGAARRARPVGPGQLRPARCRGAPAAASVPARVLLPRRPWLQNAVCARFASTTRTAHRRRFLVPRFCCRPTWRRCAASPRRSPWQPVPRSWAASGPAPGRDGWTSWSPTRPPPRACWAPVPER